MRKRWCQLLILCGLVLLSGCFELVETADETIIQFSRNVRLFWIFMPLVPIAILAWVSRIERHRTVCFILIGGVLLMGEGVLAPTIYLDQLVITSAEIRNDKGFWFNPEYRGFVYEDVEYVEIRDKMKPDSSGEERRVRVWILYYKDGRVEDIDLPDMWRINEDFIIGEMLRYDVLLR